nr:MAG TPA: hypothetical protein [Caudoviricetes sp.]
MTAQQAAVRSFYLPEVILYHDEKEAQEVPCMRCCAVAFCHCALFLFAGGHSIP